MYRLNRNIIAIFLLLTFAQGTGMRLWMHHWFHETGSSKSSGLASGDNVKPKCDCLHDATMPMQEVPVFELTIPSVGVRTEYASHDILFSCCDKIFCSLKGPPQC